MMFPPVFFGVSPSSRIGKVSVSKTLPGVSAEKPRFSGADKPHDGPSADEGANSEAGHSFLDELRALTRGPGKYDFSLENVSSKHFATLSSKDQHDVRALEMGLNSLLQVLRESDLAPRHFHTLLNLLTHTVHPEKIDVLAVDLAAGLRKIDPVTVHQVAEYMNLAAQRSCYLEPMDFAKDNFPKIQSALLWLLNAPVTDFSYPNTFLLGRSTVREHWVNALRHAESSGQPIEPDRITDELFIAWQRIGRLNYPASGPSAEVPKRFSIPGLLPDDPLAGHRFNLLKDLNAELTDADVAALLPNSEVPELSDELLRLWELRDTFFQPIAPNLAEYTPLSYDLSRVLLGQAYQPTVEYRQKRGMDQHTRLIFTSRHIEISHPNYGALMVRTAVDPEVGDYLGRPALYRFKPLSDEELHQPLTQKFTRGGMDHLEDSSYQDGVRQDAKYFGAPDGWFPLLAAGWYDDPFFPGTPSSFAENLAFLTGQLALMTDDYQLWQPNVPLR